MNVVDSFILSVQPGYYTEYEIESGQIYHTSSAGVFTVLPNGQLAKTVSPSDLVTDVERSLTAYSSRGWVSRDLVPHNCRNIKLILDHLILNKLLALNQE